MPPSSAIPLTATETHVRTASFERWTVLAGALLVQLVLGTIYGYSVFWAPLETAWYPPVLTQADVAQLAARGDPLPEGAVIVPDARAAGQLHTASQSKLKYAFGLCLLSFAGSMVFAGRIQDVRGPRFTAALGGLILSAGFLLAAQVTGGALGSELESRLVLLWLSIGLIAGVGIGFAYVSPIAALVKWFPAHKGLVSGLAVAGFGFGAYIFSHKSGIGAVGFIDRHGIQTFFNVHALVCLIVVCGGALLLRNPPTFSAERPGRSSAGPLESTWRETLRSPRFYLVWLMFFSGALAGLMVIAILTPFAGWQLVNTATAVGDALTDAARSDLLLRGAAAVGWLAIFNAVGRIFWGLASDRVGRTAALAVMFVLQAAMLFSLVALRHEWTLALGAAWVGFNFGGNFALFPSLTADLFGSRNLGANYGWVFTSYGVAGVLGVTLGNAAITWTGSYFAAFATAGVMCLLSALLALGLGRLTPRPAR